VAIKAALARGFAAGDEEGQQSLAMQAEVTLCWDMRSARRLGGWRGPQLGAQRQCSLRIRRGCAPGERLW
jgi:hypothetical protein